MLLEFKMVRGKRARGDNGTPLWEHDKKEEGYLRGEQGGKE